MAVTISRVLNMAARMPWRPSRSHESRPAPTLPVHAIAFQLSSASRRGIAAATEEAAGGADADEWFADERDRRLGIGGRDAYGDDRMARWGRFAGGRIGDESLEIGEWEERGGAPSETRCHFRTGITSVVRWLVVSRKEQPARAASRRPSQKTPRRSSRTSRLGALAHGRQLRSSWPARSVDARFARADLGELTIALATYG